jgi:superfamily II DNA or RNA helicase
LSTAVQLSIDGHAAREHARAAPALPLRPYQEEALAAVTAAEARGVNRSLVALPTGTGKAQPVDEPVLTPAGWRPIGDLAPGDHLIGEHGYATKVLGVFPQGVRPVARVEFSDGASTRCDWDHLWPVETKSYRAENRSMRRGRTTPRPPRVLTLREIAAEGLRDQRGWRHFIPMVAPIRHEPVELPLHPYLLGVLLGDGGLTIQGQVRLHTQDDVTALAPIPDGLRLRRYSDGGGGASNYVIAGPTGRSRNAVLDVLRDLGLHGCHSYEKFIPEAYLLGDPGDREALLQGLLDTDGTVTRSNGVEYSTSSPQLAQDVAALVRSLGGACHTTSKTPSYTYKGERRQGRVAYRLSIALPEGLRPFRVARKANRWQPRTKYQPARAITAVEDAGTAECVCIQVEDDKQLYVTRDYVVTHNTVCFAHLIDRRPGRALVIAHRDELIQQAAGKLRQVAPSLEVGIVKAEQDQHGADVVVASIQTLARQSRLARLERDFTTIVVDECFPAGTLIGDRPIEEVRIGDLVPSYDQSTGQLVQRRVTHTWRRSAAALVRVELAGAGAIVCTPNHPILTPNGWVPAGRLTPGQEVAHATDPNTGNLRRVRYRNAGDHQAPQGQIPADRSGLLLRPVPRRLGAEGRLGEDGANQPALSGRANAYQQPDAPWGRARAHAGHLAGDRAPATGQEGQRVWSDGTATVARGSIGLADGGRSVDWDATRERLPDLLQAGYGRPDPQGERRGRWGLAWSAHTQGAGRQEGPVLGWARVDRIALLEPGRDGTFGGVCPDGQVYNLEVDGTHTYLANGVVAHNCHHGAADTYVAVLRHFGVFDGGPLCVGFTATPERADSKALGAVWEEIVYQRGILEMIAAGYLCDLRGQMVGTDADLARLKVRHGDLQDAEIAEELLRSGAIGQVAGAYVKHAADRTGLAFTPTVQTAYALAEALVERGIRTEALDGTTPRETRRGILQRLADGTTQVVVNCGVLCLDDQTEILTDHGWAGIDEMSDAHQVANWDNGRIFFECPLEIVRRDRLPGEDMVTLETVRRSVRVTGGHRMLYRTARRAAWHKAPARELVGRKAELPICGDAAPLKVAPGQPLPVDEKQRRRLISATAYNLRKREGYEWEASFKEAARRTDRKLALRRKAPAELTLDECALIGFWIGDGSINRLRRSGVEYILVQSLSYPAIVSWIDEKIAATGLHAVRRIVPRRTGVAPYVRWSIGRGTGSGSQEHAGFFPLEPYLDKDGSPLLWGLSHDQFDALIAGLWAADGDHGQAAVPPERGAWIISATNHRLLSCLQAIAVCRGWSATITGSGKSRQQGHAPLFTLALHRRRTHTMSKRLPGLTFQQEPGWRDERLWCVKTTTRNIITRRRGTVTVMGNTEGFDEPSIACVLVARPTRSRVLYCLDDATEALTPQGWLPGRKLAEGDTIAAFDSTTGEVRWEPIQGYVRRPLLPGERMLALQSPSVDLRVTDTHRMVWRCRVGRAHAPSEWRISTAGELAARADAWELPVAGHEKAPGVPLTDAELEFIAWVQTDGSVNRSSGSIRISQSTGHPERCAEIERVLDACVFQWRYEEDARPTNYGPRTAPQRIYRVNRGRPRKEDRHLRGWGALAQWLPKTDSGAWQRLTDMDADQWATFLRAWHLGDGAKQAGQSWTRRGYHLHIADRWVADWVQAMCVRRGWRANVVKNGAVWTVHCRGIATRHVGGARATDRSKLASSPAASDEQVWCVSVPSGALLVRRNGKAAAVGNTQMIGRGTRLHPGKDDCLILDLAGVTERHDLATVADLAQLDPAELEGKTLTEALAARQAREEEERGSGEGGGEEKLRLPGITVKVAMFKSRMRWLSVAGEYVLPCDNGAAVHLVDTGDAWRVEGRRRGREPKVLADGLSLEYAQGFGEDIARRFRGGALARADASWRSRPPNSAQISALKKWRIKVTKAELAKLTAGEVSDMINTAAAKAAARKAQRYGP